MRRREFIKGVAGSAAAWPLGAHAQQSPAQTIGWLSLRAADTDTEVANLTAFRQGLNQTGYVESKNLTIEFRHGGGRYDALPELAADLVRRRVAVIVTSGGGAVARVVQAATSTIPIVFASASDPVREGIVKSINRPGANTTGIHLINVALGPRRLELLRELVPSVRLVGFLKNPSARTNDVQVSDIENAARMLGVRLHMLDATNEQEVSAAFTNLAQRRVDALLMGSDPLFQVQRDQVIERVARLRVPAMYEWSEFVKAGGLVSYSADRSEMWRQMGIYVTRILNGAKPAELPVMQPTKFELVINRKTAKALGLTVPPKLLFTADEVIE
jgi:putative tryptophan/tyrosine transport system substrate-binding protein